jgi:hypothetical protein
MSQGGATIFKSQEGKGSTFGFTFAKSKLVPAGANDPKKSMHAPVTAIDK